MPVECTDDGMDELKFEKVSRQVLENRLLTGLSDGQQVAILADETTLDMILNAIYCAMGESVTWDSEFNQLASDMERLREAAFGQKHTQRKELDNG